MLLSPDFELRVAAYRTRDDDDPRSSSILLASTPRAGPSSASTPRVGPSSAPLSLSGTHLRYLGANSGDRSRSSSSVGQNSARLDVAQDEDLCRPISLPLPGRYLSSDLRLAETETQLRQDPALLRRPPQPLLASAPPILPQQQSAGPALSPATSSITSDQNLSPMVLGNWSAEDSGQDHTRAVSLEKGLLGDVIDRSNMHSSGAAVAHGRRAQPVSDDYAAEDDTYGPCDESPRDNLFEERNSGILPPAFSEASEQARTRLVDAMRQAGKKSALSASQINELKFCGDRIKDSKEFWIRRAKSLKALTSEHYGDKVRSASRAS